MLIVSVAYAYACSDKLDIKQAYAFDLHTMPYPKQIADGETLEIRCRIMKEGDYSEARFFIRYFQTVGKGSLCLDDGTKLIPNDLYYLTNETFRLYYTSHCTDQQNLDVYIEDNFGRVIQKTFSFANDTANDDTE
jgi:hypothetical protein